ncbi:uncharacterized protein LOC141621923 [Silene latifolia]|uniref:uncharacterized protein LOC141621923 n=1 Tax=Silene latifolia TaxID=37657 RepID=UPI003D775DD8
MFRTDDSLDPHPDYPEVRFVNSIHRTRFYNLERCDISSTKFLCRITLEKLGIYEPVAELLNGTGMNGLNTMSALTYPELTLEFFSSFTFSAAANATDHDSPCVSFRLFNRTTTWTLAELGSRLGLSCHGESDTPRKVLRMLSRILAHTLFEERKLAHVHLPPARYFLCLIGGTIFGRKEPNNINNVEWSILGGYLNIDSEGPFVLNIAYLTAQYFNAVGKQKTGAIVGGGIATYLARSIFTDFPRDLAHIDREKYLNVPAMLAMFWLDSDQWTWKICGSLSVTLPYTDIRRLVPLTTMRGRLSPPLSFYYLPLAPPTIASASKKRKRPETGEGSTLIEAGQSSTPTPTPTPIPIPTPSVTQPVYPTNCVPPPPFEASEVIDQGRRDSLLLELLTRQARMERDQALALFPLYEYHMKRGRPVPDGWPHPSFYRYPAEGYPKPDSEADNVEQEERARADERRRREQERDPDFVVVEEEEGDK